MTYEWNLNAAAQRAFWDITNSKITDISTNNSLRDRMSNCSGINAIEHLSDVSKVLVMLMDAVEDLNDRNRELQRDVERLEEEIRDVNRRIP